MARCSGALDPNPDASPDSSARPSQHPSSHVVSPSEALLGSYAPAAHVYDLLHSADKDYDAEARTVAGLIREAVPAATAILDVACGPGRHAEALSALGFIVDGVDLEPAFVATAAARCAGGTFVVGDMTSLTVPKRYDAVICLFSAIGYARTIANLNQTLARFARHLRPQGVVIVDPWFEPGQLTDRLIAATAATGDGLAVCRLSRTFIQGHVSRLEFTYLIGTPEDVDTRTEVHELGLFTQPEMETAFEQAGLMVERRRGALRRRGVYIGRVPPLSA
jgi:dTDP-3-amino-3,4,6-trideoxy-alpha-D-glucopyranose N,N-dimethyltransferase